MREKGKSRCQQRRKLILWRGEMFWYYWGNKKLFKKLKFTL
jgi:hypothetical protein